MNFAAVLNIVLGKILAGKKVTESNVGNNLTNTNVLHNQYIYIAFAIHLIINSTLPCSLIIFTRLSITINVPVLPMPALEPRKELTKCT